MSSVEGPFIRLRSLTTAERQLDLIAARAHHRLDELAVRVFISPVDQLGQSLWTLRAIVVAAAEAERTDRVVRRSYRENAHDAGRVRRVANHGCLGGLQVFAQPPAWIEAAGRERMRSRCFRRTRHENHLLDTEVDQFV